MLVDDCWGRGAAALSPPLHEGGGTRRPQHRTAGGGGATKSSSTQRDTREPTGESYDATASVAVLSCSGRGGGGRWSPSGSKRGQKMVDRRAIPEFWFSALAAIMVIMAMYEWSCGA